LTARNLSARNSRAPAASPERPIVMMMYRRMFAVLGAVLAVVAFGGLFLLKASAVGPSTWSDRAQVTGYATSDLGGRTSGPVSVELDGASAARIDEIVGGLPAANMRYPCAENSQEYRISFSSGRRPIFRLTGYWCHNLVVVVPARGPALDRIDRYCVLLAAVRRLLPARATATHTGTCVRASERLFLAASKKRAPSHRLASHRVLRHGTESPVQVKPVAAPPKPSAPPAPSKHRVTKHPVTKHPVMKHHVPKKQVPKHRAPKRRAPKQRVAPRQAPERPAPKRVVPQPATSPAGSARKSFSA
jgi:hypothetical protein